MKNFLIFHSVLWCGLHVDLFQTRHLSWKYTYYKCELHIEHKELAHRKLKYFWILKETLVLMFHERCIKKKEYNFQIIDVIPATDMFWKPGEVFQSSAWTYALVSSPKIGLSHQG